MSLANVKETEVNGVRISDLSRATGVSVATLKFYLREGLLMPGRSTGQTRAEYDEGHVERVRLIRALVESGGLGLGGVRAVVEALEHPPRSRHDFLGAAHRALPPPVEPTEPTEEMVRLMERLDWAGCVESPLLGSLARAVADARTAGVALPEEDLVRYAQAAAEMARVDVAAAVETGDAQASLHMVVVGTVMVDPVISTLRRLAQEIESARLLSRRGG